MPYRRSLFTKLCLPDWMLGVNRKTGSNWFSEAHLFFFLRDGFVEYSNGFIDLLLPDDEGRGKLKGMAHGLDDQPLGLGALDDAVHPVRQGRGPSSSYPT